MFDLTRLKQAPAGFGQCGACPYLQTGSAEICFACASKEIDQLPPDRCDVCEQRLGSDGTCPNLVCRFDDRYFESVYAISTLTGTLEYAIKHYKYVDAKGWAAIFGRVLVGFLDEKGIGWFDLITPSPTYVGPNGRTWDHTATVIAAAAVEAGARLPFDVATPSAIIQTGPTRKFVELSWRERKQEAEGPMRRALSVPNPTRVAGKRVLVFDDVFTEGFKIREVARALILAGAAEVSEVVLARVPAPANWA